MDRRQYTADFKQEAVRLSFESGKAVKEVADDLGINPSMLTKWRGIYRDDGSDAFRGHGKLRAEDEEFRRLKKENEDIKQERDILKKALALSSGKGQRPIFSRTQR